jgi:predicted lipase
LIFTGHSLGGALSALASAKLAHFIKEKEECKFKWENLLQKGGMEAHLLDSDACKISDQLEYLRQGGERMGIELYTFGQPRVGNKPFADIFNKLVPRKLVISLFHFNTFLLAFVL